MSIQTLLQRFEANYIPEPNSGCWIWLGPINSEPRATVHYLGRQDQAARVSYALYRGAIPQGMCVCHFCDTPLCVNPDHLWLGTRSDNMRDMYAKGRHARNGSRPLSQGAGGVAQHQSGGWRAYAYANGKQIHIGKFPTRSEAVEARAAYDVPTVRASLAKRCGDIATLSSEASTQEKMS